MFRTGDTTGHRLPEARMARKAAAYAVNKLQATFPSCPIIVTIGNNDVYPRWSHNSSIPDSLRVLGEEWSVVFANSAERVLFERLGSYSHVMDTLRILSLNTLVFSPNYAPYPPSPEDFQLQQKVFAWFAKELAAARELNQKYMHELIRLDRSQAQSLHYRTCASWQWRLSIRAHVASSPAATILRPHSSRTPPPLFL